MLHKTMSRTTPAAHPSGALLNRRVRPAWPTTTDRIGGFGADELGTIHSQFLSGSGLVNETPYINGLVASNMPIARDPEEMLGDCTCITFVSPTRIDIGFTDLDPNRPDPFTNVTVTLMLTPVPEPGTAALWLAGLGAMTWVAWRRLG